MSLTKKSNEENSNQIDLKKLIEREFENRKTAASDFAIIPDTMIPAPESFEEFRNLRFIIRNDQYTKEVNTDGTVHTA